MPKGCRFNQSKLNLATRDLERERGGPAMATVREKEREAELESTICTNCLLIGLDPASLSNGTNDSARFGHFCHSNPRMGEQLLYFLLSALRGPVQSAKDFGTMWPIIDSAQSKDFRKIVQGIISELQSKEALPRSNSRASSLATCFGPRSVVAAVPEDVGTTGALRVVAHHLTTNDVLTVSGNLVCDVSPGAIASTHRRHGASVTTLMCNTTVRRPTEPGSSGGKDKAKKKSGIILWG